MEKVGVMAVVEGLSQFNSGMKSIDSTIRGLVPGANMVQSAFQKLGSFFTGIFSSAIHIVEYALGNLLAGAIRDVISAIKDMIDSVFEAGKNFQTLSIRLTRLNFNEVSKTVDDYTEAMAKARDMTEENLKWLQKLAVMSPYDADDVALVYTMARSYGFASTQAQQLTEDTLNFAAGMGLTADHIKRIIYNFGQMEAAQKVTGRELRDLANSFVPVNDILLVMQERTGLTGDAFDDFRNSAEGVDMFLEEFSKLVGENYSGAATDLARTFEFASQNAKDLLQSLLGLSVIKPILDTLGGKMADFIDALTSGGRFEVLQTLFGRIGESISRIVSQLLNLGPSTDDLVTGILKGVLNLANWFEANEGRIVGFFTNIVAVIREEFIPWVRDKLIPSMQSFFDMFKPSAGTGFLEGVFKIIAEKKPVFDALAKSIGQIFTAITGESGQTTAVSVVQGIADAFEAVANAVVQATPSIINIITWIGQNQETVAAFVKAFLILQVVWAGIITIAGILIPIITFIGTTLIIVSAIASSAAFPFIALGIIIASLAVLIYKNWDKIEKWTKETWGKITAWTKETWNEILTTILGDLLNIYSSIVQFVDGAKTQMSDFGIAVKTVVDRAKEAWKSFIDNLKAIRESAVSTIAGLVIDILSYMDNFVDDFGKKGYNAAQKFLLSLVGTLNKVVGIIKPIIEAILQALGPLLNLTVKIDVVTQKPGGPCFTGETRILQPDGRTIPIEKAVEGTPVMCWDGNGSLRETVVVEHIVHESELRTVWKVEFVSGTHFDVTPHHVVRSNGRWIPMWELGIGDSLTKWNMEEDTIVNIVPLKKEVPVYNLHVEDEQHNYLAEGHIVHNKKIPPPDTVTSDIYGQPAPSSVVTNSVVNNFDLIVNSLTRSENVIADFEMMRSLII